MQIIKYLLRYSLLATGFALTTMGLMTWQAKGFSLEGLWFGETGWKTHPVHLLVLGIAMIPPTLWEVFVLENSTKADNSSSRTAL